jgi:hypothetical protein
MTLIISIVSKYQVIQISDRLVSKSYVKFDELSNKSIVFYALNGILAISYTGHAFIGKTPTDQWLSEILIGRSFSFEQKPPAMSFGKSKFVHIGPAITILKESLSKKVFSDLDPELRQNWINSPFYLSIAGWLWGKKRFRPFIGWLEKLSGSKDFVFKCPPRHSIFGNKFIVSTFPPSNMPRETSDYLINELSNKPISKAEETIVDTIQNISKFNKVVGEDCMSILIPPPPLAQTHPLRVKYISHRKAVVELKKEMNKQLIRVSFTPWLIGPRSFSSPSIVSGGGTEFGLGLYKVIIDTPQDHQIAGLWSSLERPKI